MILMYFLVLFFFFNDTATTEIYTLSLHDALPICPARDLGVLAGSDDRRNVGVDERPQDDVDVLEPHGARCASYVPNWSRRALQISPTVQCAARASRIGWSRFPSPAATFRTRSRAASATAASRSARTRWVRSTCRFSDSGSRRWSSISSSSCSANRFTPTTTRSPDSTWRSNS